MNPTLKFIPKGNKVGSYELWIPGRPVPLSRPRSKKSGRPYDPAKNRLHKAKILKMFKELKIPACPWPGPIRLHLYFCYLPEKTVYWGGKDMIGDPDLDNLIKTVQDALNTRLWEDDNQIVGLLAEKAYHSREGTLICFELYAPTYKESHG